MSKPAAIYYQNRAEQLKLDDIPQILNGRPRILWRAVEAHQVSLPKSGECMSFDIIRDRYKQILFQVGDFTLRCAGERASPDRFAHAEGTRQNAQHVKDMIASMVLPPKTLHGTLEAVCIEAIPDEAVSIEAGRIALAKMPWRLDPQYQSETAFLQVSSLYRTTKGLSVQQTHVLAHPHDFYEPAIARYTQVAYAPFDVASSTTTAAAQYLKGINALPWAAS